MKKSKKFLTLILRFPPKTALDEATCDKLQAALRVERWKIRIASPALILCIVMAMSPASHAKKPCIQPDSSHTWDWGLGSGSAWAAFGQRGSKLQIITFMRSPKSEALKIYFHDASKALRVDQKIPGYAEWSFETGSGKSIVAVDGVGILQEFQDEKIGMVIGNLSAPDDSLPLFSEVNSQIRSNFRFLISETCYTIPVTGAAKAALKIIFSSQAQFNRTALGLNDVRDGKISIDEFAKR